MHNPRENDDFLMVADEHVPPNPTALDFHEWQVQNAEDEQREHHERSLPPGC